MIPEISRHTNNAPMAHFPDEWYYLDGSNPVGPFTRDVMRQLKNAGKITDQTAVACAGQDGWKPLAQHNFDAIASARDSSSMQPSTVPKPLPWRKYRSDAVVLTIVGIGALVLALAWVGREKKISVTTLKGNRPGEVRVISLNGGVKMEFCWIPSGDFIMGNPNGYLGNNPETKTKVTISHGYWMAKTEVTVDQWRAAGGVETRWRPFGQLIQDYNDHRAVWKSDGISFGKSGPLPVERIDWHEADNWCKALTEQQRKAGRLPQGWRYDLPTDAQWEYACRAGTTTSLNNGKNPPDQYELCKDIEEIAWCAANSGGEKHMVATKKPNAWGLHDMHGNVFEWCRDMDRDPIGGVDPVQTEPDPRWKKGVEFRVSRGGAWNARESRWLVSEGRFTSLPEEREYHAGFRPVLVPGSL
jgi:sulfatase modifying factor 1